MTLFSSNNKLLHIALKKCYFLCPQKEPKESKLSFYWMHFTPVDSQKTIPAIIWLVLSQSDILFAFTVTMERISDLPFTWITARHTYIKHWPASIKLVHSWWCCSEWYRKAHTRCSQFVRKLFGKRYSINLIFAMREEKNIYTRFVK